jgi:hypothetical protein
VKMVGTFFFDLKKKRSKEETEEQRRNGIWAIFFLTSPSPSFMIFTSYRFLFFLYHWNEKYGGTLANFF